MQGELSRWKRPKKVECKHQQVMTDIGMRLAMLRKRNKMTISGLANEFGISRNAYSSMERGEVYFSTYNLLKILDFYSIDFFTFLTMKIEDL